MRLYWRRSPLTTSLNPGASSTPLVASSASSSSSLGSGYSTFDGEGPEGVRAYLRSGASSCASSEKRHGGYASK